MKSLLIALILITQVWFSQVDVQAAQPEFDLKASASMVVNADNQHILYQKNSDEVRPIASLTKMFVQYLVLEDIHEGSLTWEEPVTISPLVAEISQDHLLANVPLYEGDTHTVRELFEVMSVYSANGATIALAEHIEGSEEAFVMRMRELADDLGIEGAHLVNTTGLHNSFMQGHHISDSKEDDENRVSARGTLMLVAQLVQDFPEILEFSEMPSTHFNSRAGSLYLENRNKLLPGLSHAYPGLRGMKTGTTDAAGMSLVAYVEGDQPLLAIVLNAGDLDNEAERYTRFEETTTLIDYFLTETTYEPIVDAGEYSQAHQAFPVVGGEVETVPLMVESDIRLTVSNEGDQPYSIEEQFDSFRVSDENELKAPIQPSDNESSDRIQVGELTVTYNEAIELLDGTTKTEDSTPIYATQPVESSSIFRTIAQWLSERFANISEKLAIF